MENADEVLDWLNEDGEIQESLCLGIEFGIFLFDGVRFALAEDWQQKLADLRKVCVEPD